EIVEDFDREIYGPVPKIVPKVNWEVTSTAEGVNGDVPILTRTLVGHVDNSSYPSIKVDIGLTLSTPKYAKGPVPVILQFGFAGFGAGRGARGPGAAPAAAAPAAAGVLPGAAAPPASGAPP